MGDRPLVVPGAEQALAALADFGVTAVRRARRGQAWFGRGPVYVAYLAAVDDGVAALRLEGERLRWAAGHGIAVPDAVHDEPGLLVRAAVPADPLVDVELVPLVVEVTRRLAMAGGLPLGAEETASRRLRRPATLPIRLLRGARHHVPWREFGAVRSEAARIPATVLAHGDLQDDNLLWERRSGALRVIDWEYAAVLPAGTDLLNLWVQLPTDDIRPEILEHVTAVNADRRQVGVLAHWLALRHLAEVATGRPGPDGTAVWNRQLQNAQASLLRARALRAGLEAGR